MFTGGTRVKFRGYPMENELSGDCNGLYKFSLLSLSIKYFLKSLSGIKYGIHHMIDQCHEHGYKPNSKQNLLKEPMSFVFFLQSIWESLARGSSFSLCYVGRKAENTL